jgi:hypothetical protein
VIQSHTSHFASTHAAFSRGRTRKTHPKAVLFRRATISVVKNSNSQKSQLSQSAIPPLRGCDCGVETSPQRLRNRVIQQIPPQRASLFSLSQTPQPIRKKAAMESIADSTSSPQRFCAYEKLGSSSSSSVSTSTHRRPLSVSSRPFASSWPFSRSFFIWYSTVRLDFPA